MKTLRTITAVVLFAVLLFGASATTAAASYEVNLKPGVATIANNVYLGNNTVAEVLPQVATDTTLYKYTGGGYEINRYRLRGGWDQPGMTMPPGEGFWIQSPVAQSVVFRGEVIKPPARSRWPAGTYFVSCRMPTASGFDDFMGFPPVVGDKVMKYDETYATTPPRPDSVHTYGPEGWDRVPIIEVGKAAFVELASCLQLECPPDITRMTCSTSAIVTWEVVARNVCGGTVTVRCEPPSGTAFPLGTTPVKCTAFDRIGNSVTCSFNVTVTPDTEPPVVVCAKDIVAETDPGKCEKARVTYTATATDNCPGVTVSCVPPSGSTFPIGVHTVICTATDAVGNTSRCSFTVTVNDAEAPTITCPADRRVSCLSEVPPRPTTLEQFLSQGGAVNDNCRGTLIYRCTDGPLVGSPCDHGTIERIHTVTDSANNSARCVQIITIHDSTVPQVVAPPDSTVQCLGDVPAKPTSLAQFLEQGGQASDNCDTSLTYTCTEQALQGGTCGGTIRRQHKLTDDCGNSMTYPQTITVRDTTPPTIVCPPDLRVQCPGDVPAKPTTLAQFLELGGKATDNCDTSLTYTCTDQALQGGTCGGTIRRTHTVTDDCGNAASCTQTITVHDTTPPTIVCPPDLKVQCPGDMPAKPTTLAQFLELGGQARDNCDTSLAYTCADQALQGGTCGGTIRRTHTVTDDCGNAASCTQTITVQDTIAPVIACPGNLVADCAGPNGTPVTFTAAAKDNCDGNVTVTCQPPSGSLFPPGTTPVTCTATDTCGNRGSCSFTVTVRPCLEIDHFPNSLATIELCSDKASETVSLTGPTTVEVVIGPNGECTETDGAGHDLARAHMTQLELSGTSSLGPVSVRLQANPPSTGEIIEQHNATAGVLDVRPFAASGFADSCFNLYVEIVVQTPNGPLVLHNVQPKRMCSVIDYKPPGPGTTYENPERVELYLPDGKPSGYGLCATRHEPVPQTECLDFESLPLGQPYPVGAVFTDGGVPMVVETFQWSNGTWTGGGGARVDNQQQAGHLGQDLNLNNVNLRFKFPQCVGTLSLLFGEYGGNVNLEVNGDFRNVAGFGDLNGLWVGGVLVSVTDLGGGKGRLELTGNVWTFALGGQELWIDHVCIKPCTVEVDHFAQTTAVVELCTAQGASEAVTVQGPTTVEVDIGPAGQTTLTDGAGHDRATTRMVAMNLNGTSSLGPLTVRLQANQPSNGDIIERHNATAGILDVRPFAATGLADSCFNLFIEIVVQTPNGPLVLHNVQPKRMCSVIDYKPPGPGTTYENPERVELYLPDGKPSGYWLCATRHVPVPETECIEFESLPAGKTYPVGAVFTDGGVPMVVETFQWSNGTWTGGGFARVDNQQAAGHLGQDLNLNNVNLRFKFPQCVGTLSLLFGEYGGNVNLEVNGDFRNAGGFGDLNGLWVGGVLVTVTDLGGGKGRLDLTGNVWTFALGGQELWIDHVCSKPCTVEVDHFEDTTATLELCSAKGTETVSVTGPTTVEVAIGSQGETTLTDGAGHDRATTRMVAMNLAGTSSMGPVTVRLQSGRVSDGDLVERDNTTPGILDIRPFRPSGLADSCFNLYVEIVVQTPTGPVALHNEQPKRMCSVIDYKPPGTGTTYEGPERIPLFLPNGQFSGYYLCATRHIPVPPSECIGFESLPAGQQYPMGSTFVDTGVLMSVERFQWPDGTWTAGGFARVDVSQKAGGTGQDVNLNNVNLRFHFPVCVGTLSLLFGEYGGNVNLEINGALKNVADFAVLNGTTLGGVTITVTDLGGGRGRLELKGSIQHLALGGQELWIDQVCAKPCPEQPVETDEFEYSLGGLELVTPDGTTETVAVSGRTRVEVYFEGATEGTANDDDANGFDEVRTRMVHLDLRGLSPRFGPIHVTLNPTLASLGQMEETANNVPGALDIPPFTAVGSADSFFDIFLQIEVGGQVFHTGVPKRMRSRITHKPPGPTDVYENPQPIPLLDASGRPTGYSLGATRHRPNPPVEVDRFEFSIGALELVGPNGTETVAVSGPTTVAVYFEGASEGSANDDDGDGLDDVRTEMRQLDLDGLSPNLGPVHVSLHPNLPSWGGLEETANATAGLLDLPPFTATGSADSFFDIFFRIEVAGRTFYTAVPKRMSGRITHKPPGPLDSYENPEQIPLVDARGRPTGYSLGATRHRPNPPVEVDQFQFSIGQFELVGPNGTETVAVSGPTTVAVYFEGATEGSANDDSGNGLDEVRTEMRQLDLDGLSPKLGPIHVSLNPNLPSWGGLEETANATPGRLDLPPFTAAGSADSFFDIFFQVEVAGQTFYTVAPKRMSGRITHKPPGPLDHYENLEQIPLETPDGRPTGYFLGATRHQPQPPVEVDRFDFSIGQLELVGPNGTETVAVSGPTTVAVYFEGPAEGSANDDNGNGREEVRTEMRELSLLGLSPSLGPIRVSLNPNLPSWGGLEETANATPGRLDVPPFTAAGAADSFFDIFFQVEVAEQVFYTVVPKRMSGRITHKPPGPTDQYEHPERIPLVTATGQPTGYFLGATRHRPNPPVELDQFDFSIGALELVGPGLAETVAVSGPTTVAVYFDGATEGSASDDNGNGREEVRTEMRQLDLHGLSPNVGPIRVRLNPRRPSWGQIEETANATAGLLDLPPFTAAGTADSFFDIFFQVEVAGQTFYTVVPKRMSGLITQKPPGPLNAYENPERIPLVNAQGAPTGYFLGATRHQPQPPVELDEFEFSLGQLELIGPNLTETIAMTGPTTVAVYFEGATEGSANDDNANGREEVRTEMRQLDLRGMSPQLGPIRVTLHPTLPSWGGMEETANATAGLLDIPPFTAAGSADSFFDIFFQVEVAGQTFYTVAPKRMSGRITHKPPGPAESYQNPERIPLVTAYGFPTGYYLGATRHTPQDTCPALTIRLVPVPGGVDRYQVEVCWENANLGCRLQFARELASPTSWQDWTGPVVMQPDGPACVTIAQPPQTMFLRLVK